MLLTSEEGLMTLYFQINYYNLKERILPSMALDVAPLANVYQVRIYSQYLLFH